MKYAALSRGADEDPISGTLGIESGSGVVSMRTFWLNLWNGLVNDSAIIERELKRTLAAGQPCCLGAWSAFHLEKVNFMSGLRKRMAEVRVVSEAVVLGPAVIERRRA